MEENQKLVLKAWLDGATVQYQYGDGLWGDCHDYKDCDRVYFNDDSIYRIKPKNIVTTTRIEKDSANYFPLHTTYTGTSRPHNLKLTWSPDGKTLIEAEVI